MKSMRFAWLLLALIAVALEVDVAAWPLIQISDCELGLSTLAAACDKAILTYFGLQVIPILVVPVALCLVPAVIPRPTVAWLTTAALLVVAMVGFVATFGDSEPSLLAALGSLPTAILALVLAIVHQRVWTRKPRPRFEQSPITAG